MSWSMAFVIVGCVWAVVVLLLIGTQREHDWKDFVRGLENRISNLETDNEWLRACYKKIIGLDKP